MLYLGLEFLVHFYSYLTLNRLLKGKATLDKYYLKFEIVHVLTTFLIISWRQRVSYFQIIWYWQFEKLRYEQMLNHRLGRTFQRGKEGLSHHMNNHLLYLLNSSFILNLRWESGVQAHWLLCDWDVWRRLPSCP